MNEHTKRWKNKKTNDQHHEPIHEPIFARRARERCQWLQPLVGRLFGSSAPWADVFTLACVSLCICAPAFAIGTLGQTPPVTPVPSKPAEHSPAPPTPPTSPPPPAPATPSKPDDAAKPAPTTPAAAPKPGMQEVFPGVFADLAAKVVEFDGTISPMLVKDPKAPAFYLEVLVCSPNTREHETFVVSTVKPSHIHAALLATGLTPGTPGSWKLAENKLVAVQPTGDRLRVTLVYTDNDSKAVEADPLVWIIRERDRVGFVDFEKAQSPKASAPGWVFAGSKMRTREGKEVYDADGSGTIIGLTTFGSEVIGWSRVISPDASVQAPEWVADLDKTPPAGTKVRVRVKKAE